MHKFNDHSTALGSGRPRRALDGSLWVLTPGGGRGRLLEQLPLPLKEACRHGQVGPQPHDHGDDAAADGALGTGPPLQEVEGTSGADACMAALQQHGVRGLAVADEAQLLRFHNVREGGPPRRQDGGGGVQRHPPQAVRGREGGQPVGDQAGLRPFAVQQSRLACARVVGRRHAEEQGRRRQAGPGRGGIVRWSASFGSRPRGLVPGLVQQGCNPASEQHRPAREGRQEHQPWPED
mmetsp:Transcript_65496/g.191678  ORF Transcript_65496/g.191678 Transcript_65496/m.191678 type:complete len:236 (+) Transcript_65496:94-801(+)